MEEKEAFGTLKASIEEKEDKTQEPKKPLPIHLRNLHSALEIRRKTHKKETNQKSPTLPPTTDIF